jgi:RNA polymerase sigma-70 factor (ECF subfamily)
LELFQQIDKKVIQTSSVAQVGSTGSAVRAPGILFTIAVGWTVIIAAAPLNIQRQHAIVEIDTFFRHDVRLESPGTMLNDQEIMERVRSGQVELFDELVNRHRPSMLRAAVSKLRNQAVAEEAVQDAFLSAFAHRHTYRGEHSFRGWLWTILLNTCRSLARRELGRIDRAGAQNEFEAANEPCSPGDALGRLVRAEQTALLFRFLDELPEVQADALRLRFFGDLKFDEIAQVMKCSTNGAKQRVRSGLERLSAALRRADVSSIDAKDISGSCGSEGDTL